MYWLFGFSLDWIGLVCLSLFWFFFVSNPIHSLSNPNAIGCVGKAVTVEYNGKALPIKTFKDYVNLYLPENTERVYGKISPRSDLICISLFSFFGCIVCLSIPLLHFNWVLSFSAFPPLLPQFFLLLLSFCCCCFFEIQIQIQLDWIFVLCIVTIGGRCACVCLRDTSSRSASSTASAPPKVRIGLGFIGLDWIWLVLTLTFGCAKFSLLLLLLLFFFLWSYSIQSNAMQNRRAACGSCDGSDREVPAGDCAEKEGQEGHYCLANITHQKPRSPPPPPPPLPPPATSPRFLCCLDWIGLGAVFFFGGVPPSPQFISFTNLSLLQTKSNSIPFYSIYSNPISIQSITIQSKCGSDVCVRECADWKPLIRQPDQGEPDQQGHFLWKYMPNRGNLHEER